MSLPFRVLSKISKFYIDNFFEVMSTGPEGKCYLFQETMKGMHDKNDCLTSKTFVWRN